MKFRHNTLFKDVYREVGLLEVLVTCLHRFATVMKLKMQQTSTIGNFYSRFTSIFTGLKYV